MNQKIKARWTAALRSGDYLQGKYYLSLEGEYCCLGVLCDLAVKDGAAAQRDMEWGDDPAVVIYTDVDGGDSQYTVLPESVMDWAGLTDAAGAFGDEGTDLASLNDTGTPFDEIAEIIELHF